MKISEYIAAQKPHIGVDWKNRDEVLAYRRAWRRRPENLMKEREYRIKTADIKRERNKLWMRKYNAANKVRIGLYWLFGGIV